MSSGAWQPLYSLTSPVRRPRRQIYVTRVPDEHGLYPAGDDLWNTAGLRATPTMSTYTGLDGPQRRQPLEERQHNRNTEEPVSAAAQGPRHTGARRQLPVSRLSTFTGTNVRGPTCCRARLLLKFSAKASVNAEGGAPVHSLRRPMRRLWFLCFMGDSDICDIF